MQEMSQTGEDLILATADLDVRLASLPLKDIQLNTPSGSRDGRLQSLFFK